MLTHLKVDRYAISSADDRLPLHNHGHGSYLCAPPNCRYRRTDYSTWCRSKLLDATLPYWRSLCRSQLPRPHTEAGEIHWLRRRSSAQTCRWSTRPIPEADAWHRKHRSRVLLAASAKWWPQSSRGLIKLPPQHGNIFWATHNGRFVLVSFPQAKGVWALAADLPHLSSPSRIPD